MKNIITKYCVAIMLCGISSMVYSQQLHYMYVGQTAAMTGAFGAGNVSRIEDANGVNSMPGYVYREITAANAAAFYPIAPPNLKRTYDSLVTANSALKTKLDRILAFTGNALSDIYLFLIDDRSGMPNPNHTPFCDQDIQGVKIAWPCAINWKNGNTYIARVSIGERASAIDISQAGGFRRWEATILHEFSHTQMLRDTVGINKWDDPSRGVDGIAISYGGDDGHWFEELQADQQQPMDEGLGNFWALEHNPPQATELNDFLNDKNPRFMLGSRSFLSGVSEMWNAPHTVICSGPASLYNALRTYLLSKFEHKHNTSYRWL